MRVIQRGITCEVFRCTVLWLSDVGRRLSIPLGSRSGGISLLDVEGNIYAAGV